MTAAYFHAHLAATDWTVADVSNFLSRHADERRPGGGGALTWRDVFNETDQAVTGISRFMEVSFRQRRRRRRRARARARADGFELLPFSTGIPFSA